MMKNLMTARKYANCDYTVEMNSDGDNYVTYVHYANNEVDIYEHNDYDRALTTFWTVCKSNGMSEVRDCHGNIYGHAPVLEAIGA